MNIRSAPLGGRDLFFESLRANGIFSFDVTAPMRDSEGRNTSFGWNTGRRFFVESLRNQSISAGGVLEKDLRGQGLKQNKSGSDIYIRPTQSLNRSMVVFDDADPDEILNYSRIIIQTSAKSFQVIYFLEESISVDEAGILQKNIHFERSMLSGKQFSDPAALSGLRWFRVPGFFNKKPSRENFFVRLVEVNSKLPRMPKSLIKNGIVEKSIALEFLTRKTCDEYFKNGRDDSESARDWRAAIDAVKVGKIGCNAIQVESFFYQRAMARGRRYPERYAKISCENFLNMAQERWNLFIL